MKRHSIFPCSAEVVSQPNGRLRHWRSSGGRGNCRTHVIALRSRVRDDQVELEAARGNVGLGQQQVKLAHDEVTLAQGRFSAGVTDNIEVTTAQDDLARANDVEIAAFYRYNIARANLARAVGSIELVYTRP